MSRHANPATTTTAEQYSGVTISDLYKSFGDHEVLALQALRLPAVRDQLATQLVDERRPAARQHDRLHVRAEPVGPEAQGPTGQPGGRGAGGRRAGPAQPGGPDV